MQGLILAAGRGTRIGDIGIPKCLLKINGVSIIEHQINCFKKIGINDILVICGYQSEKIKKLVNQQVRFLYNPKFSETNNIYSMWIANNNLEEDFVCVYGDLMFEPNILKKCSLLKSEIGLMIEKNTRDETMKVRVDEKNILEVNKKIPKNSADGNFIGMAKFSKTGAKKLFHEIDLLVGNNNTDVYYTMAIENLINKGTKISYDITDGLSWMDIDDDADFKQSQDAFRYVGDSA